MWTDTWRAERESLRGTLRQFELPLWGISSGFPLANHFGCLVHSPCWLISGSSLVCTHISLPRWILQRPVGKASLDSTHLWPPRILLCMWSGKSPDFKNGNTWSGQGPASSLNCLLFPSWSFSPHGIDESPISLPWARGWVDGGGRHLPPAYVHCLVNRVVITLKYPTAASCWFPV